MSNISSIALTISPDTNPMFDMKPDGGLSPAIVAGIIVATDRALHLRDIYYYSWIIKDVQGNRVNCDKLLELYHQSSEINVKNIITKSCGTTGYIVWMKKGTVSELGAEKYLFKTEELTTEFLRGVISVATYFNISINEVLIGKVIRLRIMDGQYIASCFNIDDLQLPSYEFTDQQLTVQCNFGRTSKSMKDRLDSLRPYLVIKYMKIHAPSAKVLVDKLMADAETIFRYTLEEDDITTIEMYEAFVRGGSVGPEMVDRFVSKFNLK